MAISPPGDIVLDVLNNADPAALEVAQSKLKAGQATAEAQRLAGTDESFASVMRSDPASETFKIKHRLDGVEKKPVPETYRKFEAMVLQTFVKSMLPAESEEIYGKGTAGEMWRSMMADEMGQVISKRGGIGIAKSLMRNEAVNEASGDIASSGDIARGASTAMVQEMQRNTFADLTPGEKHHKNA